MIGDKIKEILEARGMSQAELCRRAGFSTGVMSEIISGKRARLNTQTVERIAEGLGVAPGELLGGGSSVCEQLAAEVGESKPPARCSERLK